MTASARRRGGVRGPIATRLARRDDLAWLARTTRSVLRQAAIAAVILGLLVYAKATKPPYVDAMSRLTRYATAADRGYQDVVDWLVSLRRVTVPRTWPEAREAIRRWWVGRVTEPEAPGETWSMVLPASGAVSSPFGWRLHPVYKDLRYHTGVDIAAAEGSNVLAARAGKVAKAAEDEVWGKNVLLEHTAEQGTFYAHLSEVLVVAGQEVTRGQVIGRVGRSGKVNDAHLHFELREKGEPVDPEPLLKAASSGS